MFKRFFFVTVFMIAAGMLLQSFAGQTIRIEGSDVSISDFTTLNVDVPFDVYFTQDAVVSAKVEGLDNIAQTIEFQQKGKELTLKLKEKGGHYGKVKVFLSAPSLENVNVTKSGSFYTLNQIVNSKSFHAAIAGSGNVDIDANAPKVEIGIAGSGNAKLKGSSKRVDVDIAGSGDYRGKDMLADEVSVDIAGSGNAYVFANDTVDVDIAGSGSVYYSGDPEHVTTDIAGSGNVGPDKL